MTFKNRYHKMNQTIVPDEKTINDTLVQMQNLKRSPHRTAIIAAASCAAVALIVLAAAGVFSHQMPGNLAAQHEPDSTAEQTPVSTDSSVALPTPLPTPRPVSIALTGEPIKFNELGLDFPNVDYPEMPQGLADIAAFSEDMIMRSRLIIDGTVQNVRFNHYFEHEITAVYEVRVNDVLYSEVDIKIGDTILIEQNLYVFSCCQDCVVGLKPGGRYVLPVYEIPEQYAYVSHYMHGKHEADTSIWKYISEEAFDNGTSVMISKPLESRYNIIYPFMPPIQVIEHVGYLFPSSWQSLVTDDATPVEMDVNTEALYHDLYLRDEGFMDDFKHLIDMYVNEQYRSEHTRTSDLATDGGKIETTSNLAYQYAEKQLGSFIMVDIDQLSDEEKERIIAKTKAEPYPIIISDFECKQTESGAWIAEYSELTESGYKARHIDIPSYIELAEDTKLIDNAREYLTPAYQNLDASARLNKDTTSYWVDFKDADGSVVIRAEMRLVGDILRYTIFQSR